VFMRPVCRHLLLRAPGAMKQTRSCPAVATLSGHAWWWAGGASGREAAGAQPRREARGKAGAAGCPGSAVLIMIRTEAVTELPLRFHPCHVRMFL
jgi:hypothetical protein